MQKGSIKLALKISLTYFNEMTNSAHIHKLKI
jgi:hypothetical protein